MIKRLLPSSDSRSDAWKNFLSALFIGLPVSAADILFSILQSVLQAKEVKMATATPDISPRYRRHRRNLCRGRGVCKKKQNIADQMIPVFSCEGYLVNH